MRGATLLAVMAPLLRGKWLENSEMPEDPLLDGRDAIVVELIPGTKSGKPDSEGIR